MTNQYSSPPPGLPAGARVVAMNAQEVCLCAIPPPCASPVYAVSPVPEFGAVALSAQQVRFVEFYRFTVAQRQQSVAVVGMVTIQAPDPHPAVVQLDVPVDQ